MPIIYTDVECPKKIPCAEFEWSNDIRNTEDVMKYDNGEHGYFLEVDLGYPIELHDLHSDYPLAPEILKVSADMVSDFSKRIYSHYHDGKPFKEETVKKLVLNVKDKTNYVVHIRTLEILLGKRINIKTSSSMYQVQTKRMVKTLD